MIEDQIARRRKALGLTQKQVAERIGVDPSFISLLEHSRRDPALGTLRDIAVALSATLEVRLVIPRAR